MNPADMVIAMVKTVISTGRSGSAQMAFELPSGGTKVLVITASIADVWDDENGGNEEMFSWEKEGDVQ